MKYLKGAEVRQMWLNFFSGKGHKIIPSASLVPHDDPTLLWINAGVAPLKKYFDGREKPENPRMCNAQKSIRTNDIDNVGRTSRHHTFFEMLGNFSIGDYFRDEVIPWAVELLFDEKWYGFEKDKIYITYYPEDKDTYNDWVKAGIDPTHLIPLEGNFWEIGEGPCGPDTEIFYDRGTKYDPENIGIKLLAEDIDNDRYIEIWNIVLSQFNSVTGLNRNEYPELPSKNIDTGSGLERLVSIFQGTDTNFETDLFLPLINYVENLTGKSYNDDANKMAFRVIADHIRSVTFAVADGAMLSNEGRGYVLRRILRRAVRYGKKLGINEPFLYKMVSLVVENYKDFYGYLVEKQQLVETIIKKEEIAFLKTLENGEKKILDIIAKNKENGLTTLSGKDTFLLYDTFGFPLELTEEACEENGFTVDVDGFKQELQLQKERARKARNVEESMNVQNEAFLNFKKESTFVGYDTLDMEAKVIGLFKDGKEVNSASGDVIIVLDKTPFYAEMGGQVGDEGTITINGNILNVLNTFKLPNGEHAMITNTADFVVEVGQDALASVNAFLRENICSNHSCTHLVNEALRKVLGSHVSQHGSLVSDERLRFDFNHFDNISKEQLLEIEQIVNNEINKAHPVVTHILNIEDAKKTGAQAVFGEKYGDVVRVVDMEFSKEFCGGTHVKNTSEIKKFALIGIESKGSGIYRLEGFTGDAIYNAMYEYLKPMKDELTTISKKVKEIINLAKEKGLSLEEKAVVIPQIIGSYQDVLNFRQALADARIILRDIDKAYNDFIISEGSKDYKSFINNKYTSGDHEALVQVVNDINVDSLKDIIDKIVCEMPNSVVFFADVIENQKIIFICKSTIKAIQAGNIVRQAAIICGGNGGGRPDFAQAGGKDVSALDQAINKVKELI